MHARACAQTQKNKVQIKRLNIDAYAIKKEGKNGFPLEIIG